MNVTSRIAALTSALAAGTLLVGCASSTGSTASSSTDTTPGTSAGATAAQPACTAEAVTPVVQAWVAQSADTSLRQISGLQCQDGWAVIFPTIGPSDGSDEGTIDVTLVAKGVDGAWVLQERDAAVCGTSSGDATAPPSDAAVPAELYRAACQTN